MSDPRAKTFLGMINDAHLIVDLQRAVYEVEQCANPRLRSPDARVSLVISVNDIAISGGKFVALGVPVRYDKTLPVGTWRVRDESTGETRDVAASP